MSSVSVGDSCRVCGEISNLSRCSRCHKVTYCSKAHQTKDWKVHKKTCQPVEIVKNVKNMNLRDVSHNASSSSTSKEVEVSNPSPSNGTGEQNRKLIQQHQWSASNSVKLESYLPEDVTGADNKRAATVCNALQKDGLITLNNFLPKEQAEEVRTAIMSIYAVPENFIDGEIVKQGSNLGPERVRGDRIRWIDENYTGCKALRIMCKKIDKLVQLCGKLSSWNIESRTKPMVACYPGDGACYKRHVDNPAGDGRRITCLYYINKNWNAEVDGGSLCIYPQLKGRNVKVQCEPVFNRLCIFLSDSRNPHEVLPTYKQRFAVTCWYFDRDERQRALQQWADKAKSSVTTS